ncbi:MAG: hypothetical protein AAF846_08385 [Chloroflexota bacterium]
MISLKLWRALSKPPKRHPLFQYVLLNAKREEPHVTSSFIVWVMMLATVIFTLTFLYRPATWIILASFVALNSIYSVRWVLRIARTLTQEKESRRYDLLATMPIGLLGTSWALSTGAVHKRSSFRWIPYLVLMIAIMAFISLCGLSTVTLTLIDSLSDTEQSLMANLAFAKVGIFALPVVILFYIDHIYSILTAIVFGQLATYDVKNTADGQIRALFGFLTLQIMFYTLIVGLTLWATPSLFGLLDPSKVSDIILFSIISITTFVAVRELILTVIWRMLVKFLSADHKEIALVLKPFYEAEAILRESEKARVRRLDATGKMAATD